MNIHGRHVALATVILLVLLLIATVAARAQDFSGYSGAQLYQRFCASCHGEKGYGDGPVSQSFTVMVPDLTRIAKRQNGVYPEEKVRQIIDGRQLMRAHGSRTMPVWGYEFQSQNDATESGAKKTSVIVQRLADYVRSMQVE
jgi:mono/diheme cytochrome c family protein